MPDGAGPSMPPGEPGPETTTPDRKRGLRSLLARFSGGDTNSQNDPSGTDPADMLSDAERDMMSRLAVFRHKRVDDVAIPRADIIAVDHEIGMVELLTCFSEANHSRLPVYRGDLDDPIGMVHIKDLVGRLAGIADKTIEAGEEALKGLIRPILYVPPSMPVTELLLRMQASRIHMALVIDEFGGTDGLLTSEDLIELIVGDIRDEHDEEARSFRRKSEDVWEADARVLLDDLELETGREFTVEDDESDTIGGLVFFLAGRVPVRGEVISHPQGAEFEIVDADARRINRVIVRLVATQPTLDDAATGPNMVTDTAK